MASSQNPPPPSAPYPAPATLPPIPPTPRRTLPLGVAILSVLIGLLGILILLLGLLILVGVAVSSFPTGLGPGASFGFGGLTLGAIAFVVGLILLGIATALWRLRLWALVLGLIVLFFVMLSYAASEQFLSLGFLLSLVLFIYLVAVNRHFR